MKFILTTLMACVCLSMFGNIYTQKTTVEQCEEAMLKATNVNVKILWEMRIECIKDANLQNNFDAFKNKFVDISKKYNRTFENEKDYQFAKAISTLCNNKEMKKAMANYADGKNFYVNFCYNSSLTKLNKEQVIDTLKEALSKKNIIIQSTQFVNKYVVFVKDNQNLLTSNETIFYLKEMKRIVYPNIAKSEQWKNILVNIELLIKANE